jgi:hypothetical protein
MHVSAVSVSPDPSFSRQLCLARRWQDEPQSGTEQEGQTKNGKAVTEQGESQTKRVRWPPLLLSILLAVSRSAPPSLPLPQRQGFGIRAHASTDLAQPHPWLGLLLGSARCSPLPAHTTLISLCIHRILSRGADLTCMAPMIPLPLSPCLPPHPPSSARARAVLHIMSGNKSRDPTLGRGHDRTAGGRVESGRTADATAFAELMTSCVFVTF